MLVVLSKCSFSTY